MTYIMESTVEGRRIEEKTDRRLLAEQLDWVGIKQGQRVLDLGCAAGTTCRAMAEVVGPKGRVIGVDMSADRIAEARNYPGHKDWIEYRQGAAEAIPARDGEFDVTWSRFLFEYLKDPWKVIREMTRVTRPGGIVAVSDIDGNCIWHYPMAPDFPEGLAEATSALAKIGFDPHAGRKLFYLSRKAGLAEIQVHVRPYHVIPGRIAPELVGNWDLKLKTVASTLERIGWDRNRVQKLAAAFKDHLESEDVFTYSVLITVKGTRP